MADKVLVRLTWTNRDKTLTKREEREFISMANADCFVMSNNERFKQGKTEWSVSVKRLKKR